VRYVTGAQLAMEERMLAQAHAEGAPRLTRADAARALGADPERLQEVLADHVPGAQDARTGTRLRLPVGVRRRQLAARTLLVGMMLALADGRPAHLTRVHRALTGLGEGDQRRPGVLADWKDGLTCSLTGRLSTRSASSRTRSPGQAGRAAHA